MGNATGGNAVDAFFERLHDRLISRAATIDEILSESFVPRTGDRDPAAAGLAARRLAAWQRSCAAADDGLFSRRLGRDGWSRAAVEARFEGVQPAADAPPPLWLDDALWIEAVLQSPGIKSAQAARPGDAEAYPFEPLFVPALDQAESLVWSDLEPAVAAILTANARACLRRSLLAELSGLCVPALYERFGKARVAGYGGFLDAMKAGGFRDLFEAKPVLLRLVAAVTRQWIDTSREFVARLAADLPALRRDLLGSTTSRVDGIEGDLSDRHNGGRSVLIVRFEDGARIAYKPKDLRLDVAWHSLIERLNRAGAPLQLRAVRTIAQNGYGWTEFIDHTGCADQNGCERFFRRAGAWLALLHVFAATDMHQENMIASGEHPVPIDLETILQPSAEEHKSNDPEGAAFDAAMEIVGNSVLTVGLLPAYGRSVDNNVFAMGGMTPDWNLRTVVKWNDVNTDAMRPARAKEQSPITPNLPHVGGDYAKFRHHIDGFVTGFSDYAHFLSRFSRAETPAGLFEDFAGLPVRKVVRPTRFYYMLLQRLKDHRSMDDGAVWSAQADFVARLSEWDEDDPLWPLHRAERSALVTLNVPHFTTPSDGNTIGDAGGVAVTTAAVSGFERAVARVRNLDEREIAWQIEVIRENTQSAPPLGKSAIAAEPRQLPSQDAATAPTPEFFLAEADRIAAEIAQHAIRRGPSAAWIGLDWLGDAEVFQLVCLGPDLYNGATGIALFLAAHAAATGSEASGALARAALSHLRKNLKSRNAARMARALGLGGATGLGSIVYGFTVMARSLRDDDLLADANRAALLFTDDLIAADKQLDVMGGSAGAVLALLRLYRDGQSGDVLARAVKCGEHLLGQSRSGGDGRRSWVGQGLGLRALNGMSHGAAGFAYALAALAAATGRDDFAEAAADCLAFENSSYDGDRHNWPDLRGEEPLWPCQWCHGAAGIGLARLATAKRVGDNAARIKKVLTADIRHALEGAERGAPMPVDTLCCGTLGNVEFFCEAAAAIDRADLRELAARRLKAMVDRAAKTGDYRWNSGKRQFNLGLFRGLAGVGYTLLRQADRGLPNVLIWE